MEQAQQANETNHRMTTILGLAFGDGPNFTADNPLGAVVDVLACSPEGDSLTFHVHVRDGVNRPDPKLVITTAVSKDRAIRASDVPGFDLNAVIESAESFVDHNIRVISTEYRTSKEQVCIIETPVNFRLRIDTTDSNIPRLSNAGRLIGSSFDSADVALNYLAFRIRMAKLRSDWPFRYDRKFVSKIA